jgi:photosystem II stability/assembly factor-like uncharacterized protein
MKLKMVLIAALLMMFFSTTSAAGKGETPTRLHVAVNLVRGSVSGGNVGSYGPYVRESDSTWLRLSRSNVITYGFGSVVTSEPRRLYVAAGNGLQLSLDDGKSWRILTGWETLEILGVLPHPVDTSLVYVSTPWGVYCTRDAGKSWKPCMTGFKKWFVRQIAFDHQSTDVLYATSEDDLYVSRNGGGLWHPLGVGQDAVLTFLQHPLNPDLLLVGCEDGGIRISTDGGDSWNPAKGIPGASIYALAASADGKQLYAAGWESGIWRSTNNGTTWEILWDPDAIQAFFCLLVDPHDPQHLYAGADGNGVYESFDGGRMWKAAGLGGGKIKQLFYYP